MRVPYCCNPQAHQSYYANQGGSGVPVYGGIKFQRGYGLGNVLGSLVRSAVPLLKQGAKAVGKRALKAGLSIAQDALSSSKSRVVKRRRVKKRKPTKRKAPAKKHQSRKRRRVEKTAIHRDIFD